MLQDLFLLFAVTFHHIKKSAGMERFLPVNTAQRNADTFQPSARRRSKEVKSDCAVKAIFGLQLLVDSRCHALHTCYALSAGKMWQRCPKSSLFQPLMSVHTCYIFYIKLKKMSCVSGGRGKKSL